jgi:formylglycine-generating enzyme required for sulfatase activity
MAVTLIAAALNARCGTIERARSIAPAAPVHPGSTFRECSDCPELVVIPPGSFVMGSPDTEPGRGADEAPLRTVAIPKPFAVGRLETTRSEYLAFLKATGRSVQGGCVNDRLQKGTWAPDPRGTFRDPGFAQAANHPAICVTWDDAVAYIEWINGRTTGGYRLLSESEWEYVARSGSAEAYPWGSSPSDGCADANTADLTIGDHNPGWVVASCRDGSLHTAAAGSFRPNRFRVFDMIGNVSEWVEDCATSSYDTLPSDGSANRQGDCSRRMVRGGSWGTQVKDYRSANRMRYPISAVDDSIGIRVAKTLRPGVES